MDSNKKFFTNIAILVFLIFGFISCNSENEESQTVKTGADVLLSEQFDLIKNKNLGIITNHTGLLLNRTHLVDSLHALKDVTIVSLFGPEHGIRGDAADGQSIKDGIDSKTGLPVYSLYGQIRKPTKEMLKNVDILLFDIQDVGARFYTFISTMYYGIKSAAENNIPIIILDRPNPINGITVDGPMLDTDYKTFVGIAELPIQHGMTVGELAQYFNQPSLLGIEKPADLKIVKMKNWSRKQYYDECKLNWIKPSPNIPNLETAIVYPGLCLLEGTNISEGRGTYSPFLQIGSPYINPKDVIKNLDLLKTDGCKLKPTTFTPIEIPNMSKHPKFKDQVCKGISITVTDRSIFNPIEFGIKLIYVFNKLYPQKFSFREKSIDRLWGSNNLREKIIKGSLPEEIIKEYQIKLKTFIENRKKHILY